MITSSCRCLGEVGIPYKGNEMPLFHKANMAHKPVEVLSEQLDKRSDGSQEHVESDGNDFFFFASKVFEGFNESELDKMYEMRKKGKQYVRAYADQAKLGWSNM